MFFFHFFWSENRTNKFRSYGMKPNKKIHQISYLPVARSAMALFVSWMNEAGILRSTSIAGNWRWLRWWRRLSMDELSCFSLIASIRGTWLLICVVESSAMISDAGDCSSMAADSDNGESFNVFDWLWFSFNSPSGFSTSLSGNERKRKKNVNLI